MSKCYFGWHLLKAPLFTAGWLWKTFFAYKFETVSEPKLQNQRLMFCHNLSIFFFFSINVKLELCKLKWYYDKNILQLNQVRGHLCFTITEKGHLIVPDWYYRILGYTKTYGKNKVFQFKLHENLIQYCLVVDFR